MSDNAKPCCPFCLLLGRLCPGCKGTTRYVVAYDDDAHHVVRERNGKTEPTPHHHLTEAAAQDTAARLNRRLPF
jgi:hypothetical protein